MAILTLRRVHILAFIEEDGWMEEGMRRRKGKGGIKGILECS